MDIPRPPLLSQWGGSPFVYKHDNEVGMTLCRSKRVARTTYILVISSRRALQSRISLDKN